MLEDIGFQSMQMLSRSSRALYISLRVIAPPQKPPKSRTWKSPDRRGGSRPQSLRLAWLSPKRAHILLPAVAWGQNLKAAGFCSLDEDFDFDWPRPIWRVGHRGRRMGSLRHRIQVYEP